MRFSYMLAAAMLLTSCAQGAQTLPSPNAAQLQAIRPGSSGPVVKKVDRITATQTQKITISGKGFGTAQPYNGDSAYLQIKDVTGGWSAGLSNGSQYDAVFLNVTKWTDKKIEIAGFTGSYGLSYWVLNPGDSVQLNVWNAQTGAGPGTVNKKVK